MFARTKPESTTNVKNNDSKPRNKKLIKIITTVIVGMFILAISLDLLLTYPAAAAVEVSHKGIDGFRPVTSKYYEVDFNLTLKNPTNENIHVEKLTYNLYLEFQFIFHGEKKSFSLRSGENNYAFLVGIDISELPTHIREQLLRGEITIKVTGLVIFPLKIIDIIKISEIIEDYHFLWDIYPSKAI